MKNLILALHLVIISCTAFAQNEVYRMDSLVSKYVENSEFNGTVLVARGGKILLNKGYGYSNADQKTPNAAHTVFGIASITKTFTSALILKLQEAGKLSVRDQLSTYYPEFPNGNKITIHHLLTHTSGLSDYVNDEAFRKTDQSKELTLSAMMGFFKDKPLDFEPGTKFRYSNSGYTMLGYIIEKITSQTYASALQQLIFKPLGMKNTSYGPDLKNGALAQGYNMYFKNFQNPSIKVHPSISYATGAVYSTTEDLYKWHRALQGRKFLSKASLAEMYKRDKGPYGYGWFTDSLYQKQRVSHDGQIHGYKSNINRFPAYDVCVVALSNSNNAGVGGMVRNLVNIIYQKPLSKTYAEQPVIAMVDSLKQQYQATYRFSQKDSMKVTVKLRDSKLLLSIAGQPDFEIYPVSKDRFKSENTRVEFMRNNQGKVAQIYIYRGGEFWGLNKWEEQ